MTRNCLKHLVLFFLSGSATVRAVDTSNPPVYREEDYEKLDDDKLGDGSHGVVSKVREKRTGKIYALKTFTLKKKGYLYAKDEINALKQLDHENIIKIVACSDMRNRREEYPVHIVLGHMPCDLNAALGHPETKKNRREILRQVLSGVAHIHSKRLAHGDLRPANILIDPVNMSVKICDFGGCGDVEEGQLLFPGRSADGYYRDILWVVQLMELLYLGECSSGSYFFRDLSRDEIERIVETQKNGVPPPNSELKTVYEKMKGVISEKGLDLFIQLIGSKRIGGCTTAAEALRHPFFTEGREQDPLPSNPKQDPPTKKPSSGSTTAAEGQKHPFFAEGREQDPLPEEPKQRRAPYTYSRRNPNYNTNKTQQRRNSNNGSTIAGEELQHPLPDDVHAQDTPTKEPN
ncbi:MAG: CMGC protein kinase, partial [Amphiamblys sp. WSBS2006]